MTDNNARLIGEIKSAAVRGINEFLNTTRGAAMFGARSGAAVDSAGAVVVVWTDPRVGTPVELVRLTSEE